VEFDQVQDEQCFILQPNCSLSWHAAQRLFWATAVFVLGFAGLFALMGAWLVLPFAGLEVLALAYVLWWVFKRQRRQQVLRLGKEVVVLEDGLHSAERRWQCQRAWCRMSVVHVHPWYPRQVWLRCHSRRVQIGDFLTDDERKDLQQQLRQALSYE